MPVVSELSIDDDIGDASDLKTSTKAISESGKKKRRPGTPARKSSFQYAKTSLAQGTERIRKRSVGKVTPLQLSMAELSVEQKQVLSDVTRFISQPEEIGESHRCLLVSFEN